MFFIQMKNRVFFCLRYSDWAKGLWRVLEKRRFTFLILLKTGTWVRYCQTKIKPVSRNLDVSSNPFAKQIADRLFSRFIRAEAAEAAKNYFKSQKGDSLKPTISNLTLMTSELKQEKDLKGAYVKIKTIAEDRYGKDSERKRKKLEQANDILDRAQECSKGVIGRFADINKLEKYTCDDDSLFLQYLEAFLMHGKYLLHDHSRQNSQEGKENKDEQ